MSITSIKLLIFSNSALAELKYCELLKATWNQWKVRKRIYRK